MHARIVLTTLGSLIAVAFLGNPASAAGAVVGQANLTFGGCPAGSDVMVSAGVENGAWTFAIVDANPGPSGACLLPPTLVTITGAYNPSAPGCVVQGTSSLCFGSALAVGPTTTSVILCAGAIGGCASGSGTFVRA
jgi:hypothetical protein